MKWRFGTREKFALVSIVLVMVCAILLHQTLMQRTTELVVEHELVDLRDEAELRCWEMVDAVNRLRSEVSSCAHDVRRLDMLIRFLSDPVSMPGDRGGEEMNGTEWWEDILAVRVVGLKSMTEELFENRAAIFPPPPDQHISLALSGATGRIRAHLSPILVAELFPAGTSPVHDGATPKHRVPVVWAVCRTDSDPTSALAILLRLGRTLDLDSRHLSFLLNDSGHFLLHPSAIAGSETSPPQTFKGLYLGEMIERINTDERWARAERNLQVQRGSLLELVPMEARYLYLEGEATDALVAAIRKDDLRDHNGQARWNLELSRELEELEVRFGGPSTASRAFRILAQSEGKIAAAVERVNTAYRERFPQVKTPVYWNSSDRIELKHADVQLARFYLRLNPEERPEGPESEDPAYYFGFAAFRDELTFGVEREFAQLQKDGILLALLSGFTAFLVAVWFVRPLRAITRSANKVAGTEEATAKLQHQIEEVRRSLPVHKHDEVGDIARALESLLRQVINGHERLRQLNADLDGRVREKTRELQEAYEELRGLASAKDEFLASVSHELRQPLNSIFGYLQFLEMSDLNDEQAGDAQRIRHASTYLLALINDILDYQKIIMGGMQLEPGAFEGREFLEELRDSMFLQAQERENVLEFAGMENIGTIFNDRGRLRQILINLLSNACKFTHNGRIGLSANREGDDLILAVTDTGRGLKPEEKHQLFVKFKKLAAREGNKAGTGLGLVISKGLCELMGGDISCQSTFGAGTTFTVRVPARIRVGQDCHQGLAPMLNGEPAESQDAGSNDTGTTPMSQVNGNAPLVLVIDDDESVRDLMSRFLKSNGYRVSCAGNGESGLALAEQQQPAAITLDVVLPDEDGWQVLSRLKTGLRTRDIPVVMVTFKEEQDHGYALGASDYLVKPIEWENFSARLQRLTANISKNASVLVVDDNEDTRTLFRRALEREGMTVVEASDGDEALEQIVRQPPAMILLDLMMPHIDGFAFVDEFRRHPEWREIPILVVTAKDTTPQERERLNGCVRGILQKGGSHRQSLLEDILAFVRRNVASLNAN